MELSSVTNKVIRKFFSQPSETFTEGVKCGSILLKPQVFSISHPVPIDTSSACEDNDLVSRLLPFQFCNRVFEK